MSSAFRSSLDRLLATAAEQVAEVVESEEARFYEDRSEVSGGAAIDVLLKAVPAPLVLTEPVGSLDGLRALIRTVEYRWRLVARLPRLLWLPLEDYTS